MRGNVQGDGRKNSTEYLVQQSNKVRQGDEVIQNNALLPQKL